MTVGAVVAEGTADGPGVCVPSFPPLGGKKTYSAAMTNAMAIVNEIIIREKRFFFMVSFYRGIGRICILPLFMIGFVAHNAKGTVNLLQQHHAKKLVGECHSGKAKLFLAPG